MPSYAIWRSFPARLCLPMKTVFGPFVAGRVCYQIRACHVPASLSWQLADNPVMPLPPPPIRRQSNKTNNELLFKGILCALIGLAVLISPYFIKSPGMQGTVASASLVGWFALVLGVAFIGVYGRRRLTGRT